jgi:hypothetical protein
MQTSQNPQFYSLYATLFNYNNWGKNVYNLDRDWGQVIYFIEQLNGGKSRAVSSPDGIYSKVTKPRQEVVAQLGAANGTLLGTNLTLVFVDPTYTGFRVKDVVFDDKYNYGRVVAASAGTITIEPFFRPTALVAASHFTGNSYVMKAVDVSGNFNSLGKTNLYKEKTIIENYASVQRDSCEIARREKFNTLMSDGIAFYWNENEREMVQRFYKDYVTKCLFSVKGTTVSPVEGAINGTEGIREAIINQGGWYVSSTTALTQPVWEDMLNFTSTSYAKTYQDKVFLMGRSAWQTISGFYTNNINFTVSQRTAGGQSLNFDVKNVTIAGITATVMIADFLNDNVKFPALSTVPGVQGTKMSNSIFMIDAAAIPSDGPEMAMLPSIEKFHFANDDRPEETIWKMVGGMTGAGAGNSTGPNVYNNYQLTSTVVDGASIQVLGDNGISCIADNWALWELAD